MSFVTDVPAYLRKYRKDIDKINEKILGEQVISSKSAPKQTRTPSTHRDKLAPNGIDQLLKERRKRAVTTQTTQAVPARVQGNSSEGWFKKFTRENKLLVSVVSLLLLSIFTLFLNKLTLQWTVDAYKQAAAIDSLNKKGATAERSCTDYSATGIHELDAGCFRFDNVNGTGVKLVTVRSDGEFSSIRSEFSDKPNVTIKSKSRSTCQAGASDDCHEWVVKNSFRNLPGGSPHSATFEVAIPPGQRLVINTNAINW